MSIAEKNIYSPRVHYHLFKTGPGQEGPTLTGIFDYIRVVGKVKDEYGHIRASTVGPGGILINHNLYCLNGELLEGPFINVRFMLMSDPSASLQGLAYERVSDSRI